VSEAPVLVSRELEEPESARPELLAELETIIPVDAIEQEQIETVRSWIRSGAGLWRVRKPATPPMHLVVCCGVVDGEHILLVDHITAEAWLPSGGHVDLYEHPRVTVSREMREELGLEAIFLRPGPLMLSYAVTRGATPGHTDVSLWYALKGARTQPLEKSCSEFRAAKWFGFPEVPLWRSDPHMGRFLNKVATIRG
jgi:8-oxo-dGTP diphosphatase